jgi:hypothetical protein
MTRSASLNSAMRLDILGCDSPVTPQSSQIHISPDSFNSIAIVKRVSSATKVPLQEHMQELNEWAGKEVLRLTDYAL